MGCGVSRWLADIDNSLSQIIILIGAAVAMLITRITSYYWPDGRTRADDDELREALRRARLEYMREKREREEGDD